MQYDKPFSNHDEMADLMERGQIALFEDRYNDSIAILNEVATKATDAEDRMFGAGIAVLIFFNNILKGNEPKVGTPLHNEIYNYLKIAVESYDNSHPLAQEEFRKDSDINQFKVYLAKMEKEIVDSGRNLNTNQNISKTPQIYLYKNNQQFGPYDEATVKQWLQNGQCSPNDLAFRQGTNEWIPLGTLLLVNEAINETLPTSNDQKKEFKERMLDILGIMKGEGALSIKSFQVEDDGSFEIKTFYSDYHHRTWLKFETTEDGEIVRMELTHLFGILDIRPGLTAEQVLGITNQLIDLLKENIPHYRGSSAYLGVRFREENYYVFLNAAPIFLTKWSDEDIAEALKIQFLDLVTSLMFVPPSPIIQFVVDEE